MKKSYAVAVAAVFTCAAISFNLFAGESSREISPKEKVVALLNSIETGDQHPVTYINPDKYIQHNLAVADGLAGFGALLQALPEGSAKVNVKRVFQDGQYVFTHTYYDFFGPKVGFDVFRFENGLIVEHWDNLAEKAKTPNPSGRTQLDGPIEVEDLEKTDENKKLVSKFIETVLVKGDFGKLPDFVDDKSYHQHNTDIADGLDGLGRAIEALARQGIQMVYTTNHIVLGEGNFVLAISEGTFGGNPVSNYDLFRVSQGKIVEHWDVIESIPPREDWKNDNGKFGGL